MYHNATDRVQSILDNVSRAISAGIAKARAYTPYDFAEHCSECRDNGYAVTLCREHLDQIASYDTNIYDLRMTAIRALEMFRRMDAIGVPDTLIESQARLIEQHLIGYIPTTLISKAAVESEIAEWRSRIAARKAG